MNKIALLIVSMFFVVFSLDHISAPYTAVPGASVSSSGWNSNIDTLINGVNRGYDTIGVLSDSITAHRTDIDSKLDTIAETDLNMSDQDIDSVSSLTTTNLTADTISLSGNDIAIYETVNCTLFSAGVQIDTATGWGCKIGSLNILHIPELIGNHGAGEYVTIRIDSDYKPTLIGDYVPIMISNNGTTENGSLRFCDGATCSLDFYLQAIGTWDAGNGGLKYGITLTYY